MTVAAAVEAPAAVSAARQRRAKPVKWWAAAGVAYLAVTVYAWAHWLASGDAYQRRAIDQPHWRVVLVRTAEVGLVLATLVALYLIVIRPWRRNGRLTRDGLIALVFVQMYTLHDPLLNYGGGQFHFNPVFFNLGCPQCHVPGFTGPRGEGEPLLFIWGMYVPVLFGSCLLCGWLLNRARQRWPEMGNLGLALIAIGFFVLVDIAIEFPYLRLGLMSYPGAPLALWEGKPYAYPVFEIALWGVTWAGFALARYFVNDKGQTVAERGIERVVASPRRITLLRWLAIAGLLNTIYLAYSMAMLAFAVQGPGA